MRKIVVNYSSKPGMWELYSGSKTITVNDEKKTIDEVIELAENAAFSLIRRDFPDRPRDGWYIEAEL